MICCECGKDFSFEGFGCIVFESYRVVDGKELPVCNPCLNKNSMPCAYIDRMGSVHSSNESGEMEQDNEVYRGPEGKPLKLNISREALRERIANDPDLPCEAGTTKPPQGEAEKEGRT